MFASDVDANFLTDMCKRKEPKTKPTKKTSSGTSGASGAAGTSGTTVNKPPVAEPRPAGSKPPNSAQPGNQLHTIPTPPTAQNQPLSSTNGARPVQTPPLPSSPPSNSPSMNTALPNPSTGQKNSQNPGNVATSPRPVQSQPPIQSSPPVQSPPPVQSTPPAKSSPPAQPSPPVKSSPVPHTPSGSNEQRNSNTAPNNPQVQRTDSSKPTGQSVQPPAPKPSQHSQPIATPIRNEFSMPGSFPED